MLLSILILIWLWLCSVMLCVVVRGLLCLVGFALFGFDFVLCGVGCGLC